MRIALNMVALRGQGSRRVGMDILHGLAEHEPGDVLDAWIPSIWELNSVHNGVHIHHCRSGAIHKLLTENLALRASLQRSSPDVLFSCGDTGPPAVNTPHLLLVQQAFLAYEMGEFDFELPLAFRAKLRLMNTYFSAMLSSVSLITVQTEHVKIRLAAKHRISPDRIFVIPSAVSMPPMPTQQNSARNLEICYVASAAPHKNHIVLADVVAALAKWFPDIICTTTVSEWEVPALVERARKLRVLRNFRFLGTVDHETAMQLIRRSSVAILPSKLESFGIPYFESMAMNTPQVVADRDFAREACGDAALYADPDSGEDFANRVRQILESSATSARLQEQCTIRFHQVQQTRTEVAARYRRLMASLL